MQLPPDAVSDKLGHDRIAGGFHMLLDRMRNIRQPVADLRLLIASDSDSSVTEPAWLPSHQFARQLWSPPNRRRIRRQSRQIQPDNIASFSTRLEGMPCTTCSLTDTQSVFG